MLQCFYFLLQIFIGFVCYFFIQLLGYYLVNKYENKNIKTEKYLENKDIVFLENKDNMFIEENMLSEDREYNF